MSQTQSHDSPLADRPHVLVVDDDTRICALVARYLTEQGFVVITAKDAAQARVFLLHFEFDALVVDVMMPGESGLDLVAYIHEKLNIPVLMLTALGEAQDRISGLEAGADDYLGKPFEPQELLLRLKAIMRRARSEKAGQDLKSFKIGPWLFDEETESLMAGHDIVHLTNAEIILIKTLAHRPGQPVSREDLAEALGLEGEARGIDVHVTRLRRKLEPDSKKPRYLKTVRGQGYSLRAEME